MTLYILLRYVSSFRKVEPTPDLKIKCNMKFEGIGIKGVKTLDFS